VIEIAVIAGPAGVGKTTVAHEVSLQLRTAGVPHAVIDTDGLDDVFPIPEDQWRLTEHNLAHVWSAFRAHGTERLLLTGVYLHRPQELEWIHRATAADRVVLVELTAPDAVLEERVARREVGSGGPSQLERTAMQAQRLAAERSPSAVLVQTSGRSVPALASEIVALLGWSRRDLTDTWV
jgi:predicted kinase